MSLSHNTLALDEAKRAQAEDYFNRKTAAQASNTKTEQTKHRSRRNLAMANLKPNYSMITGNQ